MIKGLMIIMMSLLFVSYGDAEIKKVQNNLEEIQILEGYKFSENITCEKILAIVENSGDGNLTFWDPADFDVDDKEYLLEIYNQYIP